MKNLILLAVVLFGFSITSCVNESITPGISILNDDDGSDLQQRQRFICTVDIDGKQQISLFQNGTFSALKEDGNYHYYDASISSDNQKLIMYRSPSNVATAQEKLATSELLLCDISGENCQVIIHKGKYNWVSHIGATWNHNDSKLRMNVLTGFTNDKWRTIETDLEGNNPMVIADYVILNLSPSSDNNKVVFSSWPKSNEYNNLTELEIYEADFDAENLIISNKRRLTENSRLETDLNYNLDLSKILFWSNGKIGTYDLAEDKEETFIDMDQIQAGTLSWSMDSNSVYFIKSKSNGLFSFNEFNPTTRQMTELVEYPYKVSHLEIF